jgi:hypothetical protein
MMPRTDEDIFNKALSLLNELTKPVTSVTADSSANGKLAQLHYESTRDEELRINKWIFAINRALAVTHAPAGFVNNTGWLYAYAVPADSLRVLSIYVSDPSGIPTGVDHEAELQYRFKQEKGVLYCNVPLQTSNPYIKYIQKITDPTDFDDNFVEMLSCRIAGKICKAVTGDESQKANLQNEYGALLIRARAANALEAEDDSEAEGETWWGERSRY